jgi:hypothetical protein
MDTRQQPRLALVTGGAVAALTAFLIVLFTVVAPAQGESSGSGGHEEPARVEHREGSDIARVTLTSKAASRIDVQTATVTRNGRGLRVVPYGALLYDPQGGTWVFTSPEPLVFQRAAVTVESIAGGRVLLSRGPGAGTEVAVVGGAELWGAEFGVGH